MKHSISDFIAPYPERDDRNIQTKIWAKLEFRECVPDPDPAKGEYRVDDIFYNTQVFFQRFVSEYRSCFMISGPGSGKSRCYICFEQYQREFHPGEIKNFYFIAGSAQINDFKNQVVAVMKEKKQGMQQTVESESVERLQEVKSHFIPMTVDALHKEIERRSNKELKRDFGNCAFMIDELHEYKLTEKTDLNRERKRFDHYCSMWRLTHVCSNAVIILSTATPVTNDVRELIYHAALLPKTKIIKTPLTKKIYKTVVEATKEGDYEIPKPDWVEIDFSTINRLNPDNLDELDDDIKDELNKLEQDLENVLRGRIIYVREPSTGARKVYPEDAQEDEFAHRMVTPVLMSKFQSEAYAKTIGKFRGSIDEAKSDFMSTEGGGDKKNALYQLPKQASVFVFPTQGRINALLSGKTPKGADKFGRVGTEGIDALLKWEEGKFQTKYKAGKYSEKTYGKDAVKKVKAEFPTFKEQSFKKYLANDKYLYESSAKLYDFVKRAEKTNTKVMVIAEEFYQTDCLVIAATLEARIYPKAGDDEDDFGWEGKKWEYFMADRSDIWRNDAGDIQPNFRSAPRYFIYSSSVGDKMRDEALKLIAHPKNIDGRYLKVIVITEVGGVGINIFNVSSVDFFLTRFTPADDRQTEGRSFRATSHVELLKRQKKKGIDHVDVEVRYLVAVVDKEIDEKYMTEESASGSESEEVEKQMVGGVPQIDSLLYRWIYQKDFKFSKVMKMLYRIAIDAWINRRRNIRSTDLPGSKECFYGKSCNYLPFKINPDVAIDLTTYSVYNLNKSREIITEKLRELFSESRGYNIVQIMRDVSEKSQRTEHEIFGVVKYLIESETVLSLDQYGYNQYLAEDREVLYTTRNPIIEPEKTLKYYSDKLIINQPLSLEDYAPENVVLDDVYKELSRKKYKDAEESSYYFANLHLFVKVKLFEEAWILDEEERAELIWPDRVIEASTHLYYLDRDVVVHEIGLLYSKCANYNAVDGLIHPAGNLRIYKDGIWRKANQREKTYYSNKFAIQYNRDLKKYYEKLQYAGIIGIIVRPDLVHIREFTLTKEGKYKFGEGKKCNSIEPHVLIGMIYDLLDEEDEKEYSKKITTSNIKIVEKVFPKLSKDTLKNMGEKSPGKLDFYATKIQNKEAGKIELCKKLCELLLEKDGIFTVVGSASKTVKKMFEKMRDKKIKT